jgi:probable phosphoglycerate mutase
MKLYIIRHADPDYAHDTITDKGIVEARALSKRAASFNLTHIYSSPLGRARETARYLSEGCGIDPVILDWIQELNVLTSDTPYGRIPAWDIAPEYWLSKEDISSRKSPHIADGMPIYDTILSTYSKVRHSSDAFFKEFGYRREGSRYAIENRSDAQVAMVCHLGFGLTLLSHLLRIPLDHTWSGFWLPPSSVTAVLMEERSGSWAVPRVVGLGDVSHLYPCSMDNNTMGLQGNFF